MEVVSGVSLQVPQGSIVALLGANGAGKTSVLKAISGLVRPALGEIWFEGRRTDRLPPYRIVECGIIHIPERRRLFWAMSVLDNLYMGAFLTKDKEEIQRRLEFVFSLFPILKEKRQKAAETLSGGQQQMLAIGRGIMAEPKMLLMDEPSLGLAPLAAEEVYNVVADMSRETNLGVLLVEQNASLALSVANRAYIMEKGVVTLEGPSKELIKTSQLIERYLGGGDRRM